MTEAEARIQIEIARSRVRRVITYAAVGTFLGTSAVVTGLLAWKGKWEMAITLLGTIGTLAGSFGGFWFAGRTKEAEVGRRRRDKQDDHMPEVPKSGATDKADLPVA